MSVPRCVTHHSHRRAGQGGPSSYTVGKLHGWLVHGSQVRSSHTRTRTHKQRCAGTKPAVDFGLKLSVPPLSCASFRPHLHGAVSILCLCVCTALSLILILISARRRQRLCVCQADCAYGAFLNNFKHRFQACARASTPYCQLWLYRPRWAAQGLSAGVWRQSVFKEMSTSHYYSFSPLFV